MSSLAAFCYRRRWWVLALWVVLLVGLTALASQIGGGFEDEFELPGTESQAAVELLRQGGFEARTGFQGQLVVKSETGISDPEVVSTVTQTLARIEGDVDNVSVASPYEPVGSFQISTDGTIAFAELALADRSDVEFDAATEKIRAIVAEARGPGVQLELGGDRFVEEAEGGAEAIGLVAAIVILLIAFGSLLAMALPILTALAGVGTGAAVVTLLADLITMPSFTVQLVIMLGIGVGIDYALFIVTRYREHLTEGAAPEQAVALAMGTAGRSVLFAGLTVVVSLLGLLVVGLDINRALGVAAACGVAMTMLAAITLLPAVLGFVGYNIDRLGLPHRHRRSSTTGLWHRWSTVIQDRPVVPALLSLIVLLLLAAPAFSMRLGLADAGNRPITDTTRRAYDLLAEGFGPGANGPLFLAASTPDPESRVRLDELVTQLRVTEGMAGTTPPIFNASTDVALIQAFPSSAPQDTDTAELVAGLRDDIIPAFTQGSELVVRVGGFPAAIADFSDFNSSRLPVFIGVVLAVSFVLLMIVFRSVLVPLKAVILNLLSIGAAYGAVVAVFQWGWFGLGEPGPVEAWAPIMLFAVLFGLSMDYEVFLLSRIREEYDRTGDNRTAVAHGLEQSARVITAAAAIMVVVFAGFVLSSSRALQLFGLGLAVAVLVDATIVRLILVPATMELLGDRNWWLPRWLDRILPVVNVESRPSWSSTRSD